MNRFPTITPRQIVRVLKKLGFVFDHQRGSHAYYIHSDGRITTVAMHSKDIPRGTMKQILRDLQLDDDEFKKLL